MAHPLPGSWELYLQKLTKKLAGRRIPLINTALPSLPTSLFEVTTSEERQITRLHLGTRRQADGTQAIVWAYVLSDHGDVGQQIVFRERIPQIVGTGDGFRSYPRAASSLLRKATQLHPPFCFLQTDPHGDMKVDGDIIRSLVAYYFLKAGLNDYARHWSGFEASLIRALSHMSRCPEYHVWRVKHSGRCSFAPTAGTEGASEKSHQQSGRRSSAHHGPHHRETGGTIYSTLSSRKARKGTPLAVFQGSLGDRIQLLENIPTIPLVFSHQVNYPYYFPFRLCIGRYRPADITQAAAVDVHVYLTNSGARNVVRIHAQSAEGKEWSWKLPALSDVELFEPFTAWAGSSSISGKAGDKIRSLIYYCFILAEDCGLIDDPRIKITKHMVDTFCSACRIIRGREAGPYQNETRNAENHLILESEPQLKAQRNGFVAETIVSAVYDTNRRGDYLLPDVDSQRGGHYINQDTTKERLTQNNVVGASKRPLHQRRRIRKQYTADIDHCGGGENRIRSAPGDQVLKEMTRKSTRIQRMAKSRSQSASIALSRAHQSEAENITRDDSDDGIE
ncbi:hypothetical protein BKA66DRAFT_445205 [Pyrenochaeta sp. MPI-SDFR-AT-0127]|nr:hypothetical protein BKA66DRAFT_445205 [Pyrenochaeta sp. MPI-SDFR-AT-0127]